MGILSNVLGLLRNPGPKLARICFRVRQNNRFLDDYMCKSSDDADALKRLELTKDVIMMFVGASIIYTRVDDPQDPQKAVHIFNEFRQHYLDCIELPAQSKVGSCVVLENELRSVGEIIAPHLSVSDIKNFTHSTKGLLWILFDVRIARFFEDYSEGARLVREKGGFLLWLPAAKGFLSQIRGVPPSSISFDDANHLCIAIFRSWSDILNDAGALFPQ